MVKAFRERDLSHTTFPYLYLDATYVNARNAHMVAAAWSSPATAGDFAHRS